MYDWYTFLIQTYDALSVYEVQKNASAYLSTNLPTIMNDVEKYSPNSFQMEELDKVINATLKSAPQIQFDDKSRVITVTSNFATFFNMMQLLQSDSNQTRCSNQTTDIRFFISDTFFVDSDWETCFSSESSMQMFRIHIYANKWHILGEPHFQFTSVNHVQFFGWGNRIIDGNSLCVRFRPDDFDRCSEFFLKVMLKLL